MHGITSSPFKDRLENHLEVWMPGKDLLDHSKNNWEVTMAGTVTANNILTIGNKEVPCFYHASSNSGTNKLIIKDQVPYYNWCAYSIMAWIKPVSLGTWDSYIAIHNNGQSYLIEIRRYSTNSYYGVVTRNTGSGDDNTCNGVMPINTGNWSHLAVIMDGLRMRVFYNGIEKWCRFNAYNPLSTGGQINVFGGAFSSDTTGNTYLTDFRMYNKALNTDEVYQIYLNGPHVD